MDLDRAKAICDAYKKGYEEAKKEFSKPSIGWITMPNPNHSPFDSTSVNIYMCSMCGYSSAERITATWNFCPNCGERMSKEGEAE